MKAFRPLSVIEQLAAHLREEILAGGMGKTLPGVHRLAKELGVSPKTVVAAVAQLEHEGLLRGQGPRRSCQIVPPTETIASGLRVEILLYEEGDRAMAYVIDLQHRLRENGHVADFAEKSLMDLGRDVRRVAGFVERQEADAWIVFGGSREILRWFAAQPMPSFAVFGRRRGIPIAGVGPDKQLAMRGMVRRLVSLGHRRIVLLVREERRKPEPGALERSYLEELAAQGIATSNYNLPDWQETRHGLKRCLDHLFHVTPPTALVLDEAPFFTAALQYCTQRGIRVPENVSLVCCDEDTHFSWFDPPVSHIRWDTRPVVNRIVNWAGRVARGIDDRRQSYTSAEFIEGGTIGPAPVRK